MATPFAPTSSKRSPIGKRQLLRAARHVLGQREVPGLDGVEPETLTGKALGTFITELHQMMRDGRWHPYRAKKGFLPRPGKSPREHAISTLRDAVVLRAATAALADVWTKLPSSIVGGRPKGNYQHLISAVTSFFMKGGGWVLRFDIKGAFGNAPFDMAIEKLRSLTHRQDVVDLLVSWRSKQGQHFEGLVEGAAFAPLLLAVLLSDAATAIGKLDGKLLVWLDDGVFLARNEETVIEAERLLRFHLKEAGGMELHPDKTGQHQFVPGTNQLSPFHFLGVRWRASQTEPLPEGVEDIFATLHEVAADEDRRGELAERWAGWVAAVARWDSRLEVLAVIDDRFTKEIGNKHPLLGPFESLVASAKNAAGQAQGKNVALRGQQRSRARWLRLPGTSGTGSKRRWSAFQGGAVPGTASGRGSSTSSTDLGISTHSSATGAPGVGVGLAPGASSTSEAL